jgi:hypothetical protein
MDRIALPINPDTLHAEIVSAIGILEKLEVSIGTTGIPGVDKVGSSEDCAVFLRQTAGELMVVAGKCSNLASIIAE